MNKRIGIVIGVFIVVFAALASISIFQSSQAPVSTPVEEEEEPGNAYGITIPTLAEIEALVASQNFDQYNLASVIPASAASGNRPENLKGNPKAKVILYEYADYQCEHCAATNPYLNAILEEYGDQVGLVFRTYIMPYHAHGVITAAAANAAAKQGYWAEFKDIIFANQDDWFYAKDAEMLGYLDQYFTVASNGKGDLEQFHQDMQSAEIAQKIAFDYGIAEKADLQWTPSIFVEDKFISQKEHRNSYNDFLQAIRDEIDARLAGKK